MLGVSGQWKKVGGSQGGLFGSLVNEFITIDITSDHNYFRLKKGYMFSATDTVYPIDGSELLLNGQKEVARVSWVGGSLCLHWRSADRTAELQTMFTLDNKRNLVQTSTVPGQPGPHSVIHFEYNGPSPDYV
jgi:hypothetical protein